jgi:hypothetical protein
MMTVQHQKVYEFIKLLNVITVEKLSNLMNLTFPFSCVPR